MDTLKAEKRSMETKAKRLRREGYVTGNVFGHDIEGSIPVKIAKNDAENILKKKKKGSQIMLDVEGTQYDVLIKEVDFDTLKRQPIEMDFQALVKGEKVHSVAEVVLVNHEKVAGGVVEQKLEEIAYKALPEALVETVEVDLSGLKPGDVVKVKDLAIAADRKVCGAFFCTNLCQHFSFRKCAAEYFAYKRSGNNELERQCHNQVFRNVGDPYRKQQGPHTGFYTGFQTSVKGHDDDHRNHHTAGNSNGFLKRSTVRFNKKTECDTFSQM